MRKTAWRAERRVSRGGTRNLLCLVASPTELAAALPAVAARVSIVLPWGELLRDVATCSPVTLQAVAELSQPGGAFEFVFSSDPRRDGRGAVHLPAHYEHPHRDLLRTLRSDYRSAGLQLDSIERLDQLVLRDYPSTWARRLGHGAARVVWRIRGIRSQHRPTVG